MPTTTERQELAVFRSYNPGDPSPKLYIKNLARQVTEEVSVTTLFKRCHLVLLYYTITTTTYTTTILLLYYILYCCYYNSYVAIVL